MPGFLTVGAMVAVGLGMWACGGSYSSGGSGNPNSPTPSNAAGVVTVNVVAINGAQSFSPNPATLPAGQLIVWHNIDNITHRVLLNDGSVDTGDLLPGASSRPVPVEAGSGPYHCAIHPVMVGSINQGTTSQQPCTGAYCP
jgi:plastocyanin